MFWGLSMKLSRRRSIAPNLRSLKSRRFSVRNPLIKSRYELKHLSKRVSKFKLRSVGVWNMLVFSSWCRSGWWIALRSLLQDVNISSPSKPRAIELRFTLYYCSHLHQVNFFKSITNSKKYLKIKVINIISFVYLISDLSLNSILFENFDERLQFSTL